MKKFLFKTCPKTGRIRGFRSDTLFHKLLFPLVGLAALTWVIIRVVPKPSRAAYPCQQTAIPLAATFLTWLFASSAGVMLIKLARKYFTRKRILIASLSICGGIILFMGAQIVHQTPVYAQNQMVLQPMSDKPNQPIGEAKGIYPGRVTWARDIHATPWTGEGPWWNDEAISQKPVDNMFSGSIKALTGERNEKKAWNAIFTYYNKTHGKGKKGYNTNESIVIKVNLNNSTAQNDVDNNADASSQTILALLRQLVNKAGVTQSKITVIDAIRVIPDRIYTPCHAEFPEVMWVDKNGTNGRIKNEWYKNAFQYSVKNEGNSTIPKCIKDADYMINMPLLKGHEFSGVTLAAKNQYGSIAARDHSNYLKVWQAKGPQYSMLVDLMAAKELDGKTMLFIMDGLLANYTNTQDNNKDRCAFNHLFNGEWCSSIFMSLDEVAFESVGLDFLVSEYGEVLGRRNRGDKIDPVKNCDNYLHEAALAGNPPSGTIYQPDGIRLTSLGVHEHWNNPKEMKYSRNLGSGKGIELFKVHL